MRDTIYNNLFDAFDDFSAHKDDYMGALFINIFKKFPKVYKVFFDHSSNIVHRPSISKFDYHKDVGVKLNDRVLIEKSVEEEKNNKHLLVFTYSAYEWLVIYDNPDKKCSFLMNITMGDDDPSDYYKDIYTDNIDVAFDIIKNWLEKVEHKSNVEFGISAVDVSNSLYTTWYDYSNHEIDIKKNYNDDLPYDKICELIEKEDSPELMLFYGDPGTGKTSLIKHLISKYDDKSFVFIDGTLLANVSQEKLMSYFLENQSTIFILEDCEKVLMNREHYANPVMPILLNLTDGIIGDVLGIKLICTFNTALSNIDKALIRKGRLSLKYEFKKLTKDKVSNILGKTADKEMTLADIYYNEEENDYSKKQQNKIGF